MRRTAGTRRGLVIAGALAFVTLGPAPRGEAAESYRQPPQVLTDIVDAPPTPEVELSPDRAWMLLTESPALLDIAELAQQELRLAGLRILPATNGRSRTLPIHELTLLRRHATMSPFMHAERVNEPILLIHGEADNNSGTFPIQSERFYHALKGLGGTARLVMLPHESHGHRARESVLHMLWEMDRWLEIHVRNREVEGVAEVGGRE